MYKFSKTRMMLTVIKWVTIRTLLPDLMKWISLSIKNCTAKKATFYSEVGKLVHSYTERDEDNLSGKKVFV